MRLTIDGETAEFLLKAIEYRRRYPIRIGKRKAEEGLKQMSAENMRRSWENQKLMEFQYRLHDMYKAQKAREARKAQMVEKHS